MRTMRPSWVQQMTIYLCHNAGMSASQLTEFFPVTKRRINQIISAFPDNFPGVWCAVEKCNEILERLPEECEEEDLEEDASLENLQFLEISPAIANDFFDSGGPNVENGLRTIKMNQMKRQLRRAKIRASRLEGIIRKSREFHEQFEELPSYDSRPTILDEFMELNAKNPQGRRYSEQVYRFAYNLMSYSERAYRYSRKLLPLPSRSQVMERFRKPLTGMKASLTDLGQTHRLIEAFLESHPCQSQQLLCSIGIDAFAFRLFLRKAAPLATLRQKLTPQQLQRLEPILEDKEILEILRDEGDEDENDDEEEPNDELLEEDAAAEGVSELFKAYNSCFIYVLIPLNSQLPCMTLHLSPAPSGAANASVIGTLQKLINLCEMYNIHVPFICADGDSGWNSQFHRMFHVMNSQKLRPINEFSLDVYRVCQENNVKFAVTDLLHYLKAARSRYIDKKIVITLSDVNVFTDCEETDKLLNLNMVLSDKSQIGRMRDFYPIELFTIRNVRVLAENGRFADAFYFLPHALLLLVTRVPFFTHTFRMQLLNVAFNLFCEIYFDVLRGIPEGAPEGTSEGAPEGTSEGAPEGTSEGAPEGTSEGAPEGTSEGAPEETSEGAPEETSAETTETQRKKVPQRRSPESEKITWGEIGTLRRILCTIVAYGAALQLHPDNLRSDALGTHIVECKIGQGRSGADTRWQRILSNFAHASLRTVLQEVDGIHISVQGRLKTAGCNIDTKGDWVIPNFNQELFAKVMFHSVTAAGRAAKDFEKHWKQTMLNLAALESVLAERKKEIGKLWLPNPAANSAIMARLLNSDASSYGV